MFTRYFSSHRKILFLSIVTGLFVALLLGSLQFFWSYHKREVRFDTLIEDVSIYMENYFGELKASIDLLQPLLPAGQRQNSVLLFRHRVDEFPDGSAYTRAAHQQTDRYCPAVRHAHAAE